MSLFNFSVQELTLFLLLIIILLPLLIITKQAMLMDGAGISWAVPLFISLFFVFIDFQAKLNTGGNIRYVGTLLCMLVLLVINGSIRIRDYSRSLGFVIQVFVFVSVSGSLFGRIYDGELTGALPIAIPMLILLMRFPLTALDFNFRKGTILIIVVCLLINIEVILVRLEVLPKKALLVFSHEQSFIIFLGLLLAISIRSKLLVLISSLLIIIAFGLYPAATLPLAVAVAVGTYLIANKLQLRIVRFLTSCLYLTSVIISIFYSKIIFNAVSQYFTFVGKANNSDYRTALIEAALSEIRQNLIFGSFFRGSATVQAVVLNNQTYQLPVHNDYITLTLCGGLFFLSLFLILPIFLNYSTLKTLSLLDGDSDLRRVLLAMLAAVNIALASSFANPILINPGNSTIFYCLIATVISLNSSAKLSFKK